MTTIALYIAAFLLGFFLCAVLSAPKPPFDDN